MTGEMDQDETQQKRRRSYKKAFEKAARENEELKERFLRLAAEFDNYKKRIERDSKIFLEQANAELVTTLLPVLDDLDRTLAASSEDENSSALIEGIRLVQKNFLKTLIDLGLEAMQCVGTEFDPELHEALMQMKVDGQEPNMVVEEHQKGYFFRGRLIRAAKVVISG